MRDIKKNQQEAIDQESFFDGLGDSPAIRRAFRLWLDEFHRYQNSEATVYCISILMNESIDQSWKNELLITILRSQNAQPVIDSMAPRLLQNKCSMLYVYINLLRTCCKGIRNEKADFDDLVPVGSGWDSIINFIWQHYTTIKAGENLEIVIIELIKDWGKQIKDLNESPLPSGSESAARIVLDFLFINQKHFNRITKRRERDFIIFPVLQLLFKLTPNVTGQIEKLIEASVSLDDKEPTERWFAKGIRQTVRNGIVDGFLSDQICRLFPDLVINMARADWKEKPRRPNSELFNSLLRYENGREYWGLDENIEHNYDQPSAFQTCFYWLLFYHPYKAIDFFLEITNHAFKVNAGSRSNQNNRSENIIISNKPGNKTSYFGGYDYWVMFRGFRMENYVIQSMLMALEKHLIEMAEMSPENDNAIKDIIAALIEGTNNVSVLGTISSIIQAAPRLLDSRSIVILGVKDFYKWDQERYLQERLNSHYYGRDKNFGTERISSNKLKHRQQYFAGLKAFVADYMFFTQTMNKELFLILDELWTLAPPDDIYWRKSLFDMDRRKHTFKPITEPGYENYVQLIPEYDNEIIETISENTDTETFPTINGLWASKAYEYSKDIDRSFSTWLTGYNYIKEIKGINQTFLAPGTMACLALRDYLKDLDLEQQRWAKAEIITQASRHLSANRSMMTMDVLSRKAIIEAVPLLLSGTLNEDEEKQSKSLVFNLLISNIELDLKITLENSISKNLWKLNPDFALHCWYGVLGYGDGYDDVMEDDNSHFSSGRRSANDKNRIKWQDSLIEEVVSGKIQSLVPSINRFNESTLVYFNAALRMMSPETSIIEQCNFVSSMLEFHFTYLGSLDKNNQSGYSESRTSFKQIYARFLLSQPSNIADKLFSEMLERTRQQVNQVNNTEIISYIKELVEQFIYSIDSWDVDTMPIANFWRLWQILRDWIATTKKAYLIPVLLLDIKWREGAEWWIPLEGRSIFFQEFLLTYGFNMINSSIKLITGIGAKEFLPTGLFIVAHLLNSIKKDVADIKTLEKLAHNCFFKYGRQIKANKALVSNFLAILDFLVGHGSPKAFLLKEEMIQYR